MRNSSFVPLLALASILLTNCSSDTETEPTADVQTHDTLSAPDGNLVDASVSDTGPSDTGPPDTGPDVPDVGPTLSDNFGVKENQGSADCEGLNGAKCVFPFPSDYFRKEVDGQWQLSYGPETLPPIASGGFLSPEPFRAHDGYSNITPVLFRFENGTLDGVPTMANIADSLKPDSKTVILDAETGERIAHWCEFDHFTIDHETPVYTLRLAGALDFNRRYLVAVRGLVDADGAAVGADPGFVALRDQTASQVRGIHGRRDHFETEIFAPLDSAGIGRDDLQLAFDFTTASEEHVTGTVRDLQAAMAVEMGELGPEYTVDMVKDDVDGHIARHIFGTAKIPSFLGPPSENGIRLLRRDADGKPVAEGFENIKFEVQIPHKAFESGQSVAILQYGHGLFGSLNEAHNGWLRAMANRLGFVIVAISFQGFSEDDIGTWGISLGADVSTFPLLVDAPLQGLMNHVAIARMMKARFTQDTSAEVATKGDVTISMDPERVYYYGNSQGGTMGSMLMTVHSDITRGVLGVPGGAYAFLLNRSIDFTTFSGLLLLPFPDIVDFAAVFGLLQTGFQRFEPHSMVHRIEDPYPGLPKHRVLLHVAKEDAQVHNQASFMLARTLGVKQMTPSVRPVFGLEEQGYPYSGSAMVEYDFLKPPNPKPLYPPPEEHDTHGDLRQLEVAQDQLWHFLETGDVISVCDDACDPD